MVSILAKDFNIRHTIESGQPLTFFADYSFDGTLARISYPFKNGAISIEAEQKGKNCLIAAESDTCSKREIKEEIKERFGLRLDIQEVYANIKSDGFIERAIKKFYGMRVTKNGIWETSLSFIISEFNNIKRIRLIMRRMIERWSRIPSPDELSNLQLGELYKLGLGFRAKYISSFAKLYNDEVFEKYGALSYKEAKGMLMKYNGIGDKVADCILLMGYGKLEAFPIDTWIKRILAQQYHLRNASIKKMHEFAEKRWGKYAGYAQQYIYWYGRAIALQDSQPL